MNLLYNLMGEKGPELIKQLITAGLGAKQAQDFLPEALSKIMDGLRKVDIQALLGANSRSQIASLMDTVDLDALSSSLGGDRVLAADGLRAIVPQIFGFLMNNPAAANLLGMRQDEDVSRRAELAKVLPPLKLRGWV